MNLCENKLSIERHFRCVGDFTCGPDNPLDVFLSCDAFMYDEQHYGTTYVVTESETSVDILGFFTLKASGIQVQNDSIFNSIPAIEVARIAIHYDFQGQKVGKYMFNTYILPKAKLVADLIAVKAIIAFVETDDEQAIGFYKSLGFEKADEKVQNAITESFNEQCDLYVVSLDEVKN